MNTKLTLRLNEEVIERAKRYAHNQKTSISKLVEAYLNNITSSAQKPSEEIEITPLVKSLMGVAGPLPENYDYKKEYHEYLEKKYK